jgi:hypothetical protein
MPAQWVFHQHRGNHHPIQQAAVQDLTHHTAFIFRFSQPEHDRIIPALQAESNTLNQKWEIWIGKDGRYPCRNNQTDYICASSRQTARRNVGLKVVFWITSMTRARVCSLTFASPLITRETVARETPACLAISSSVRGIVSLFMRALSLFLFLYAAEGGIFSG